MIWGFKELLTWKIPEHLLSTAARESQSRLKRKQEEQGYVCSYINNTHLFQYDLVTQRVKEQKVTFVGIVMHVKQFVSAVFLLNILSVQRRKQQRVWRSTAGN